MITTIDCFIAANFKQKKLISNKKKNYKKFCHNYYIACYYFLKFYRFTTIQKTTEMKSKQKYLFDIKIHYKVHECTF